MIKKCKVLLCNPYLHIVLVNFGGMKIQLTGDIENGVESVYVKYEDGVATISTKEDYEKSLGNKAGKTTKKVKANKTVLVDEFAVLETDTNEVGEVSE